MMGLVLTLFVSTDALAQDDPASEVERVLAAAAEQGYPDATATGRALAQLGEAALATLFESWTASVAKAGVDRVDAQVDARGRALLEAFRHVPASTLRQFLNELDPAELDDRQRVAALRIFEQQAMGRDLDLVVRIGGPAEYEASASRAARHGFERVLLAMQDRRVLDVWGARDLYRTAPIALLPPIVRVISTSPDAEALTVLAGLLGSVSEMDPALLVALTRIVERGDGSRDDYVRGQVRAYLRVFDSYLLQLAARAMGALEDEESIRSLIDLLDHHEAGVASSASPYKNPALPMEWPPLRSPCMSSIAPRSRRWPFPYSRAPSIESETSNQRSGLDCSPHGGSATAWSAPQAMRRGTFRRLTGSRSRRRKIAPRSIFRTRSSPHGAETSRDRARDSKRQLGTQNSRAPLISNAKRESRLAKSSVWGFTTRRR